MPRKTKPKTPPAAWRFPARAALAATACVLAVAAVVGVGVSAAAAIEHRPRFTLPLTALDFDVPAWVDRDAFLAEVRYLGDLPDAFNGYDPAATDRIRTALAKHPAVERADGGYTTIGRRYVLTVVFREPVLRAGPRVADVRGVLLPEAYTVAGLPELVGDATDEGVRKRAAELAVQFRPKLIEKVRAGWRITERTGRVLVVGG